MKQADVKTGAGLVTKKEASQWCDVGIMKGTTCVVSYYHLTSDIAQGNGEVCYCTANVSTVCLLFFHLFDDINVREFHNELMIIIIPK